MKTLTKDKWRHHITQYHFILSVSYHRDKRQDNKKIINNSNDDDHKTINGRNANKSSQSGRPRMRPKSQWLRRTPELTLRECPLFRLLPSAGTFLVLLSFQHRSSFDHRSCHPHGRDCKVKGGPISSGEILWLFPEDEIQWRHLSPTQRIPSEVKSPRRNLPNCCYLLL